MTKSHQSSLLDSKDFFQKRLIFIMIFIDSFHSIHHKSFQRFHYCKQTTGFIAHVQSRQPRIKPVTSKSIYSRGYNYLLLATASMTSPVLIHSIYHYLSFLSISHTHDGFVYGRHGPSCVCGLGWVSGCSLGACHSTTFSHQCWVTASASQTTQQSSNPIL